MDRRNIGITLLSIKVVFENIYAKLRLELAVEPGEWNRVRISLKKNRKVPSSIGRPPSIAGISPKIFEICAEISRQGIADQRNIKTAMRAGQQGASKNCSNAAVGV